jgi:hypothetical protein
MRMMAQKMKTMEVTSRKTAFRLMYLWYLCDLRFIRDSVDLELELSRSL